VDGSRERADVLVQQRLDVVAARHAEKQRRWTSADTISVQNQVHQEPILN